MYVGIYLYLMRVNVVNDHICLVLCMHEWNMSIGEETRECDNSQLSKCIAINIFAMMS